MNIKPNFFIVGAPKCGTTALSEYLRTHPEVFLSRPKEPHYFADDFKQHRLIQNLKDYLSLFNNASPSRHKMIGEASVWYLYSSQALPHIKEFQPNAKIIVMLRKNIDMLRSLHEQLLYNFYEDISEFETSWNIQYAREKGLMIPKKCLQPEFLYYKKVASFASQLSKLQKFFPRKQVKVIFFDDFVNDTPKVYKEVIDFLDLTYDNRNFFPIINKRKEHKSIVLGKIIQNPPRLFENFTLPLGILGTYREKTANWLRNLNSRPATHKFLTTKFRKRLTQEFTEDTILLQKLTSKDLSHWLTDD